MTKKALLVMTSVIFLVFGCGDFEDLGRDFTISLIPPDYKTIGSSEGIVVAESSVKGIRIKPYPYKLHSYKLTLRGENLEEIEVHLAGHKEDLKSIKEYILVGDDITVFYSEKEGKYLLKGRIIIDRETPTFTRGVIYF